ncbi:DoxX family protein [Nocardioides sp. GXZ039]|uniref:DoxX family protein n=1 Tax=Nocardioides sp. GXZ039 TaxID=3136018 RepID=UPI0030F3AFAF
MDIALWTTSVVVSLVFVFSGVVKSLLPRERLLASGQRGIGPFPMPLVRVVAVCELAAVFGLFAPWLSDTARVLTPLAALGLAGVMYGAAVSHASLREPKQTAAVVAILCVCAFIAAGRFAQL